MVSYTIMKDETKGIKNLLAEIEIFSLFQTLDLGLKSEIICIKNLLAEIEISVYFKLLILA